MMIKTEEEYVEKLTMVLAGKEYDMMLYYRSQGRIYDIEAANKRVETFVGSLVKLLRKSDVTPWTKLEGKTQSQ